MTRWLHRLADRYEAERVPYTVTVTVVQDHQTVILATYTLEHSS
jgi:hypothetical protein